MRCSTDIPGDIIRWRPQGDRITFRCPLLVLVIGGSQHTPDELFEQAQLAEENGDIAGAERLYGILMKSDPTDASAPFNLGNLFRTVARNVEAEAALRAATRADPTFAEAWYNLSDLLDEQGR